MPNFTSGLTQEEWNSLQNSMVVKAHVLPGADAGVKIAAAINQLPTGVGGIVDATGFTNPQNLTGFTVTPGVTVILGPVLFTLPAGSPSIVVNQGGILRGSGRCSPGATTIKAFTGFNKDVIKCINTSGSDSWWFHGEVSNLRILGNKVANAVGNGVSIYGLAETAIVKELNIQECAQAGMYIYGSQSGTGSIDNCTVNGNGSFGIHLDEFRSGITFKCVGGDANPVCIGITNPRLGGGSILFIDLKSEGTPGPVIRIQGGNSPVNITCIGGNWLTLSGTPSIGVEITGDSPSNHSLQIIGLASGNALTTLVNDLRKQIAVSIPGTSYTGFYGYCNGRQMKFDASGFTTV